MANIKVTIDYPIGSGLPLTFKSPADCSQVTGLVVNYLEGGTTKTKTFQFADAHGNNVGSIDLFASNVLVKVILDVDASKAYVQNADTNAYLEGELAKKYSPDNKPKPEEIGAARIQTGSYIGTGTAGPNEAENTLTFDFVPRFVVVSKMGVGDAHCIFVHGSTGYDCSTPNMPVSYGAVSWSGTTMRWHTASFVNDAYDPARQLNAAGFEYTYTAIG